MANAYNTPLSPRFCPTCSCGGIVLLLTCVAYRQKEAPNEAQGDELHEGTSCFLWMDPQPPIARAGWPISGKKESLFLEKNHEVQPVVGCGVWDLLVIVRRGKTKPKTKFLKWWHLTFPELNFHFCSAYLVVYFENMKMLEFGCNIGNITLYTCKIPMAVKIQHQQWVLLLYIVSSSFTRVRLTMTQQFSFLARLKLRRWLPVFGFVCCSPMSLHMIGTW